MVHNWKSCGRSGQSHCHAVDLVTLTWNLCTTTVYPQHNDSHVRTITGVHAGQAPANQYHTTHEQKQRQTHKRNLSGASDAHVRIQTQASRNCPDTTIHNVTQFLTQHLASYDPRLRGGRYVPALMWTACHVNDKLSPRLVAMYPKSSSNLAASTASAKNAELFGQAT